MSRRVSVTAVVVLVAYLSLFSGSFDRIADDPGLGWHLAGGEAVAQNMAPPVKDPFLAWPVIENPYAPLGRSRTWVSEQWLADLMLHLMFVVGGWPLMYGVVAGLYVVAFFGVAGDGARRAGVSSLPTLVAALLAFKAGQVHLIIRPVIFSILLFSVVMVRIRLLQPVRSMSWRGVWREVLILGGLFALWANLHPAFVYGLCALLLAVVVDVRLTELSWGEVLKKSVMLLSCGVATLLTPYGLRLWESMLALAQSPFLLSLNQEWSPLDLGQPEGVILLILLGMPCLCMVLSRRFRARVGMFDVVAAVFFFVQAFLHVRSVPFAALACVPLWVGLGVVCEGLVVPKSGLLTARLISWLSARESTFRAPGLGSSVLVAVGGACVMLAAPAVVLPSPLGSAQEQRLKKVFSATSGDIPPEGVVFASPDWGGSITRTLFPSYRPILDDRAVVVGEELFRAYFASLRDPEAFEELMNIFHGTHALVRPGLPLALYLGNSPTWRRVYVADDLHLFVRVENATLSD